MKKVLILLVSLLFLSCSLPEQGQIYSMSINIDLTTPGLARTVSAEYELERGDGKIIIKGPLQIDQNEISYKPTGTYEGVWTFRISLVQSDGSVIYGDEVIAFKPGSEEQYEITLYDQTNSTITDFIMITRETL